MNLNSVFAKVEVTASQGIAILNTFAEANTDKDPSLVEAINKAIINLSSGAEEPATKEEEHEPPHISGTARNR